jgi:NTP pyrophosphatase (non-canonical NTP hydrolase)
MLIVTELAEAVEALRKGNPTSDKIKDFTLVEEELADAVIRLLDLSGGRKWDIVGAMMAKMSYNANRPYKHGKTF